MRIPFVHPASARACVTAAALLLLPCAAPVLAGGDPLAAGLSASSKAAQKELKAIIGAALKTAGAELKAEAAGYADGSLDATAAVDQIVATISAQRDAIGDAALAATQQVSTDGATLLADAAVTTPGRDFQAGGGGAWDKFLAAVDKALDDSDAKLDSTLSKTLAGMLKTSVKAGNGLDIRWRLPQHGSAHRAVNPPFLATTMLTADDGGGTAAPEVLIAVRFVDLATTDTLALGIRAWQPSVAVAVSSKAGEQVDLAPLAPDGNSVATGSYALTGLLEGTGFITVELEPDPTAGPEARLTLSLPHATPAAAEALDFVKQFKKDTQAQLKSFTKVTGGDVKVISTLLAGYEKSVADGNDNAMATLDFSFDVMRNLRNLVAFHYAATSDAAVGAITSAITGAGLTDADLPADLASDSGGVYGKFARSWNKLRAKQLAAITKIYDKAADKFVALSVVHTPQLTLNRVLGQTRTFSFPMLSVTAMPPVDELVRPYVSDAQILRQMLAPGLDQAEGHVAVQSDPALVATVVATKVQLPGATSSAVGSLVVDLGGGASAKQDLPETAPFVGWQFRAGQHASKQESLLIVVTPQLIPGGN